jgi:Pyridoxamine 5'-phosphate oxidase
LNQRVEPLISDQVAEALTLGVACVVATRDEQLRPEITRGWGIQVDRSASRLQVCIRGESDCRTVANLRANGQMAMNITRPTTYLSLQFKGRATVLGPPTPEQLARAKEHLELFSAEAVQVGVPAPLALRFMGDLCAAVVLEVEHVFDQTPGTGAGRRL